MLEEANSKSDTENNGRVQRVIRGDFSSCTVFTVAHRLDYVVDFDTIGVMDHGRVVELEDPEVLLKDRKSTFASM